MKTAIWTTKEGTKIPLCDMGDRHLLNTIRMIERNVKEMQMATPSLRKLPLESLAIQFYPQFAEMLKEVKKRVWAKKQTILFDEMNFWLADTPLVSPRKSRRGMAKIRRPEPLPASRVTRKIILRY